MNVCVMPVSGGDLCAQLAGVKYLCKINYVPDITLASSGGNATAYIAAAADWKWAPLMRISSELNHTMFLRKWSPIPLFSTIMGYFKGSIYNQGTGVLTFMKNFFTSDSITRHCIWTGTYNRTLGRSAITCNTNITKGIIDPMDINHDVHNSTPPYYADGDIDRLSLVSLASASIPAMVVPKVIDGHVHVDGGASASSPVSIMSHAIIKAARQREQDLHVIYINCTDLKGVTCSEIDDYNVLHTWRSATNDLIKAMIVQDRKSAIDMVKSYCGEIEIKEKMFECNVENLTIIEKYKKLCMSTMLEIYPSIVKSLDLTTFSGDDLCEAIKMHHEKMLCRFWYIPKDKDNDPFEKFDDMTHSCECPIAK